MPSLHKSPRKREPYLDAQVPRSCASGKKRQFIIYKFTYNCSQEYALFLFPVRGFFAKVSCLDPGAMGKNNTRGKENR